MKNLKQVLIMGTVIFGLSSCEEIEKNNNSYYDSRYSLPLEKVLTISAGEYCESTGKNLFDYSFIGCQLEKGNNKKFYGMPERTEVIVEYSDCFKFIGTALVPKDSK